MNELFSKKVKKIGILANIKKENASGLVGEIIEILEEHEVSYILETKIAELMNRKGTSEKDLPNDLDLLIVLGGDGTMLAAARAVNSKEIPLLGINIGRMGFLTELDTNQFKRDLPEILDGKFNVEKRLMLEVKLPNRDENFHVLNDFVLDRGESPRFVQLEILVSDDFVGAFLADGIITCTPTGSTAYNMAAGGPITAPGMSAIQLTTLSPYTLAVRPLVVDADETINIKYSGDSEHPPRVALDGQVGMEIPVSGEIMIRKAQFSAHFVHYYHRSFYDVLRTKLGWAIPPHKVL